MTRPAAIARIVPWPHAYRPRQIEHIDFAVVFAWQQRANRLIDDVEAHARLEELRAQRETLAKSREEALR